MTNRKPIIFSLIPWTKEVGIEHYWPAIKNKLDNLIPTTIIKNYSPESLNPFHYLNLANKSRRCDLLHIQHNYCLFGVLFHKLNSIYAWLYYLAIFFLKNPKIITTMHDIVEPKGLSFHKRLYLNFMNLPLKLFNDKIIVHSEITKDQLIRQGFKKSKIAVIPHGLDKFDKIISHKDARKKMHLPDKKTVLLYGWIRADKQYELVIEAMKYLPSIQLFIVGTCHLDDEGYIEFLKKQIKKANISDRVIFPNTIVKGSERFDYIACGDVMILPYQKISASGALNDAVSMHVPCITSKIPIFLEMETDGGVVTTNVYSATDLAESIKRIIDNSSVEEKKLCSFIEKNKREHVAELTKKIYDEVLYGL